MVNMYELPQEVLIKIYKYDPTYHVNVHRQVLHGVHERNVDIFDERLGMLSGDDDICETFTFHISMYMGAIGILICAIPILMCVCLYRWIFLFINL